MLSKKLLGPRFGTCSWATRVSKCDVCYFGATPVACAAVKMARSYVLRHGAKQLDLTITNGGGSWAVSCCHVLLLMDVSLHWPFSACFGIMQTARKYTVSELLEDLRQKCMPFIYLFGNLLNICDQLSVRLGVSDAAFDSCPWNVLCFTIQTFQVGRLRLCVGGRSACYWRPIRKCANPGLLFFPMRCMFFQPCDVKRNLPEDFHGMNLFWFEQRPRGIR